MVTVRDKRGFKRVWRDGLSWNLAQRCAKNARRANYRRVKIERGFSKPTALRKEQ